MKLRDKILYGAGLSLATAFLLGLIIAAIPEQKMAYDIVFLGDSIFGNVRDESSIPSQVSNKLNVNGFNGGLGGTMASEYPSLTGPAIIESSASLVSLSMSISDSDFSRVLAAQPVKNDGDLYYFDDTVKALSTIDYKKAKLIIIEHGLNDYFYDEAEGIASTEHSLNRYYDSLVLSVENIKKLCPDTSIILISPVYGAADISDYADVVKMASEKTGVDFLDMYREGVVTSENMEETTVDGIHLSEKGREVYSNILSTFIKERLVF